MNRRARRPRRKGSRGHGIRVRALRGQSAARRRGVALVMVLLLTTILGAMAADLQNATSVNLKLAANARDRLQAHFHARSAVQLELFFLRYSALLSKSPIGNFLPFSLADMSSFFVSSDTVKGLMKREGPSPDDDAHELDDFGEKKPFGTFAGSFWIEEVVDENRKINIGREPVPGCNNPVHILLAGMIDQPRYDKLFERIGESRDPVKSRLEIISNITDFVDVNRNIDPVCAFTGQSGGTADENGRYENLPYNARYNAKNGKMHSLAELRLVPGINDAFMRLFADNLTVWTDRAALNVKEASDQILIAVIRALMGRPTLPGDDERIKKFLEERALLRITPPPLNKLSKPAFEQLLAVAGIPINPSRKALLMDGNNAILKFDDPTAVYRITAVGRVGDTTSTMTVVWRDSHRGGQGDVFYWRED